MVALEVTDRAIPCQMYVFVSPLSFDFLPSFVLGLCLNVEAVASV